MKTFLVILILTATVFCLSFSLRDKKEYQDLYLTSLEEFKQQQVKLLGIIKNADLNKKEEKTKIQKQINESRVSLKAIDFWLRYLEPIAYRRINGPVPVEWQTEVFEKYKNEK